MNLNNIMILVNRWLAAGGSNLALFQPTNQSSTYYASGSYRLAAYAVDGNPDTNAFNLHCSQTNDVAGRPNWLSVDLGLPFFIDHVVLTNRDANG